MAIILPTIQSHYHTDRIGDSTAPPLSWPQQQHSTRASRNPELTELRLVAMAPERWSLAAMPTAFLETIQRIEIHETQERGGELFFVLDVFLHHFETRLPANLTYLRRAALRTSQGETATTVKENARLDYQVERRFIDFCDLRHQIYDAACLNPHVRCVNCDELIMYVRFKLRQPRPVMHLLTAGRKVARMNILAVFVNEFLHLALCKEKQSRKCESHGLILTALESFLQAAEPLSL